LSHKAVQQPSFQENGNKMKTHLTVLFWIVIANYLAQIPYSLHLYHTALGPNLKGTVLLLATFLLFIVPFLLIWRGSRAGYIGIMIFLSIEFLFYFVNFVASVIHGYPPFFHLGEHDPILFTAFLIGYINFLAAGYFLYYFIKNKSAYYPSR
jgi:hypothetical protein